LDIRCANDPQELTIDMPPGLPFPAALEKAIDAFREAYRFQNGGGHEAHSDLEVVNLRLTAFGREKRRERKKVPPKTVPPDIEAGERPVLLQYHGKISARVYDGARLGKGDTHAGPSAIEEAGSTAFVPPGGSFTIDEWGNACLSLPSSPGPPVQEMIKGTLDTALREMNACLERTARSTSSGTWGHFTPPSSIGKAVS
jgi:N-methylhydantoinase A/oxoprolinase/acetone carboxylase beta subunit